MTVPLQYSIDLEKITLNLFIGCLKRISILVSPSCLFNWNELKLNPNRYFPIGYGSFKPLALKDIQYTTKFSDLKVNLFWFIYFLLFTSFRRRMRFGFN